VESPSATIQGTYLCGGLRFLVCSATICSSAIPSAPPTKSTPAHA